MAGSSFGQQFRITTWGESHGPALGVVVDGVPAGLPLTEADIQIFLNRRKPGQSKYTTARAEGDQVEILSGIFEGKTTGAPISTKTSTRKIIPISQKFSDRDMQILLSGKNMESGITEGEVVPPAERPSEGLQPEPLQ